MSRKGVYYYLSIIYYADDVTQNEHMMVLRVNKLKSYALWIIKLLICVHLFAKQDNFVVQAPFTLYLFFIVDVLCCEQNQDASHLIITKEFPYFFHVTKEMFVKFQRK